MEPSVAVLIPCFNESATIADVVRSWRGALPAARIYVFDNNSTDDSARLAREAGALVRSEPRQGKGNVVRRMFADVDADLYLLVDGDGTYDASAAPALISRMVEGEFDMVTAARKPVDANSYRPGHRFGNRALTCIVAQVFGKPITDLLSTARSRAAS
jgi:glycosyltransferase involved in cell wall biosynthesis